MNKKIIGLTGGIASGKSAAAEMFSAAGAYIIDTDVVARAVTGGEECKSLLKKEFPEAFCGNVLDRGRLREIVFAAGDKLAKLNSITHPLILRETERLIAQANAALTVVVVPLLFESGFDKLVDFTVTVSCPEDMRIKRLTKRDSISETLARKMIAAQMTDAERESRANAVIRNCGAFAELRAQVIRLYCELTETLGR